MIGERGKAMNKCYDLIIIGGGGSGLSAAWAAMESGVNSICIVEALHTVGGISRASGGFFYALDTQYTRGQPDVPTVGEAVKQTLDFHHYEFLNPQLVRHWMEESKYTISFLESRGFAIKSMGGKQVCSHLLGAAMGTGSMAKLLIALGKELTERGADILLDTSAVKVLRDDNGRISGVVIRDTTGEEEPITCKAVILACGGFMANKELLYKYFPDYYTEEAFQFPLKNMGNGIALAESAGAKLNRFCSICVENGFCFTRTNPKEPGRIHAATGSVWVNSKGRRYCDENLWQLNYSSKALLKQPGKIGYSIYSRETLETALTTIAGPMASKEEYMDYLIKFSAEGKHCKFADTLEELAVWIGAKHEVLRKTIDEYNGFCEAGEDRDTGKDPNTLLPLNGGPWLAVKIYPLFIDTIGPVVTDEDLRIVDDGLDPIPGFYSAGAITSGWLGHDYFQFGSNLSFAFTSGRIAGMTAAKELG